jgi:hypothetical protein
VDDIHAREHISLTAADPLARLVRLRFDSPAVMASQLGLSSLSLVYSSVLLAANSFNPFIYLSREQPQTALRYKNLCFCTGYFLQAAAPAMARKLVAEASEGSLWRR